MFEILSNFFEQLINFNQFQCWLFMLTILALQILSGYQYSTDTNQFMVIRYKYKDND